MIGKVIVSGLTAAGKTTHARLLADEFGIRSVHYTDLLLKDR
jgi:adenylate kinase family enzyme